MTIQAMTKKQIFRIGIKNFPAAHGGVEAATYNFVQATKDKYDFTIFTVWNNPTVKNNEVDGVRVYQLAKGWFGRFKQIKTAVKDKKNTVLHFHMEIFIPLAIAFSLLGYNVVSSIHGRSFRNPKIGWFVQKLIWITDVLGVNFVGRTIYVAKADFDAMRKYTLRKFYWIPNGSAICNAINEHPSKDMVFIWRISVQKNLLELISAADRDSRELDIYGPFDEREVEHAAAIKEALAKSVHAHYCGVLAPEEVYPTLGQYRCAVNPSKAEASPNAVIEAGACGLYLYLSDISGHRGVGYPDVYYFDKDDIRLPVINGTCLRSTANVKFHLENLSIGQMIERYGDVYESFY